MCELSVIIPVCNTKPVLPRCVDSILGQSFTDFELLLVDDGSTDGSGAVCDDYAANDSRVRVFHKEWGGPSSARNVGLDNAKGRWVTFIDSDDFVDDGYFALLYADNMDLYVRNWRFANGQVSEHLDLQTIDEQHYWSFLGAKMHTFVFRTGCSSFFKRALIENNGIRFDDRFHLGEDSLFMLDYLMQCANLQTLDGPTYRYDRSECWESKHTVSWHEAECLLTAFIERYERLPVEASELAAQIFGLFREQVSKDERHMHCKWLRSVPVKRFIETQMPVRGRMFRLKYVVKEWIRH